MTSANIILGISVIVALGIGSQWLSWKLKIPSIVVLILCGSLGNFIGIFDAQALFGRLFYPVVSMSVAIILFEGGMTLKLSELQERSVVRNLVTIGVIITWVLITIAAKLVLGLSFETSLLLGAILVVTGPTVIGPLIRQIKPIGQIGVISKWEGILNDPIGVMLSVLVFEIIIGGALSQAPLVAILVIVKTLFIGCLMGLAGALLMTILLKRYLIPDYLHSPVTLAVVLIISAVSNIMQAECGLLAVTMMGIILANQKAADIRHILEFKENLRVLIISTLFIVLASAINFDDLILIDTNVIIFTLLLVIIVRPAAVILSTLGTNVKTSEKAFLSLLAPRGIVAAAVSSLFALELTKEGLHDARVIAPITFFVILFTVVFYSIGATIVARKLKLAIPNPTGVLIVGGQSFARQIAGIIKSHGFKVLLVDTNRGNIYLARKEMLPARHVSILSENVADTLNLGGLGNLLALTSNDEVNTLACIHLQELFQSSNYYQFPPEDKNSKTEGRLLFHEKATYNFIQNAIKKGAKIKEATIGKNFSLKNIHNPPDREPLPLFTINKESISFITTDSEMQFKEGSTIVFLQ